MEKAQIQGIVEDIVGTSDTVQWRYSAYSNERFPLRAYASALRGTGPDADEILVIAITWRTSTDDRGDRLIIGADILGEDGMLLAESPRFEISIPGGNEASSSSGNALVDVTNQARKAMRHVDKWLDSQTSTIQEAITRVA